MVESKRLLFHQSEKSKAPILPRKKPIALIVFAQYIVRQLIDHNIFAQERSILEDILRAGDLSGVGTDDNYTLLKKSISKIKHIPQPQQEVYFAKLEEAKILLAMERRIIPISKQKSTKAAEQFEVYRNLLILHNLPLAISIATHYQYQGVVFLDLVQEAFASLIISVDNYDFRLGHSFSKYASVIINNRLADVVKKENTAQRLASDEELEDEKPDAKIRRITLRPVEDIVADYDEILSIRKYISTLSERQALFLELRFGLKDGIKHSLRESGAAIGITKEGARQLENRLRKRLLIYLHENN